MVKESSSEVVLSWLIDVLDVVVRNVIHWLLLWNRLLMISLYCFGWEVSIALF